MSMKRLAVLAAVQTAQYAHNGTVTSSSSGGGTYVIQGYNMSTIGGGGGRTGRYETDLHGNVNILLGGAMLSGVVIVVVLVCYCCHRNIRKHQPQEYSQYWRAEPDVHSLEVFTMDSHAMCYERAGVTIQDDGILAPASAVIPRPVTPGPPPAYESLIFNPESLPSPSEKKETTPTTPVLSDALRPSPPPPPTTQLLSPMVLNSADITMATAAAATAARAVAAAAAELSKEEESRRDDEGLPSYEAALKLEANGYV